MKNKTKLVIGLLAIVAVIVTGVKFIAPTILKIQDYISGISAKDTGGSNSYQEVIDTLLKSIETDDSDMYLSVMPFDYLHYPEDTSIADFKSYVKDMMPRIDTANGRFEYGLENIKRYSGTYLENQISLGIFSEIDSRWYHGLQECVNIDVSFFYIHNESNISEHYGTMLFYKLQDKWYIDPVSVAIL